MQGTVYPNVAQTTVAKRIERLEKLSRDLTERFGERHQLSLRVAEQLDRARAESSSSQEVAP